MLIHENKCLVVPPWFINSKCGFPRFEDLTYVLEHFFYSSLFFSNRRVMRTKNVIVPLGIGISNNFNFSF